MPQLTENETERRDRKHYHWNGLKIRSVVRAMARIGADFGDGGRPRQETRTAARLSSFIGAGPLSGIGAGAGPS